MDGSARKDISKQSLGNVRWQDMLALMCRTNSRLSLPREHPSFRNGGCAAKEGSKRKAIRAGALCFAALIAFAGSTSAETVFHVALTGSDGNPGTRSEPFATLERCREAVRLAGSGKVRRVIVHGGSYELRETFTLSRQDSGTLARPVTWQAAPGEIVRLVGGISVPASAWHAVAEAPVLARLDPVARGRVVEVDLRALGVTNLPPLPVAYHGVPPGPELFFNDSRMTLARWPNEGWATNEIHHVCTETDDCGALYKGRNPSCRGNQIRFNYWHDIGSPMGHGNAAVYFDDGDGGDTVFGNVFVRCGEPGRGSFGTVFSHGGHGIRAENNIFVDCKRALGSAPWDDTRWRDALNGGQDCFFTQKLLQEVDITKPPYTTRYPELVGYLNPKADVPRVNHARLNLLVRCGEVSGGNWRLEPGANWSTKEDPGFVDSPKGDYRLRRVAPVFKHLPGFKPVPFEKMGLDRQR